MDKIKVAVSGACGKMGREVIKTVLDDPELVLVSAVDRQFVGEDIGKVVGRETIGILVKDRVTSEDFQATKPNVLVDFTIASSAVNNAVIAVKNGVSPVIGTSGIGRPELNDLRIECEARNIPALLAPNFSLGAVLMMQFAQLAAKYLPNCEIIELHHDNKLDAPSGTAIRTAELINSARKSKPKAHVKEQIKFEGARGAEFAQVKIHSVRLSGFVAHQEVIFGGEGEILTLRHDSMDRKSFMPGVAIAIKHVSKLKGLVVGLEHILDLMD